jgi:hypothetical protein
MQVAWSLEFIKRKVRDILDSASQGTLTPTGLALFWSLPPCGHSNAGRKAYWPSCLVMAVKFKLWSLSKHIQ